MNMFANVKVGDRVVELLRHEPFRVLTVTKVTAKYIYVDEACFRESDGGMIGLSGSWRVTLDPDAFVEIRRRETERSLREGFLLTRASIERMKQIAADAEAFLREQGKWIE
jgi:hypothetical protein